MSLGNPEVEDTLILLAEVYTEAEMYNNAIEIYEQIINQSEGVDDELLKKLADLYKRENNHLKVVESYWKLSSKKIQYLMKYYKKLQEQENEATLAVANRAYELCLSDLGDNDILTSKLLLNLAETHLYFNNKAEAIRLCNKYLDSNNTERENQPEHIKLQTTAQNLLADMDKENEEEYYDQEADE